MTDPGRGVGVGVGVWVGVTRGVFFACPFKAVGVVENADFTASSLILIIDSD